ncbi:MAG TPA: beta-L-arabinofuranosidase domain-containing protein [Pseudosphingobacterium sp.]|nr:beta-L-arabinofuranosidase domain-containing protein [Pseudosphingobacterium sp.]
MRKLVWIFLCVGIFPPILCAQSHYPGQHAGKFKMKDQLKPAVYSFDLADVRLLDSRFKENMEREQLWLDALSVERLLHGFRTNAGIYDANEGGYFEIKKLAGWESLDCELRGHTIGHMLSGLSFMYASTGNEKYKKKGDSLVNGLAEVQRVLNQDGYLSAFPQELINRNIAGKRVWAPWYTLHKIFSGLLDQYLYCDNLQALDIASKMGTWAYNKLQTVSPEQRTIMLRNEFGGINESFYNLYAITGNPEYKWLAAFFYHNEMLDPLKKQQDILNKKHANTYIPKLLGLTRAFELAGEGDEDAVASFFWQTVIDHHSFATGSNSDKEKFFEPDHIAEHLSGYTGESCNVYNMLKLTRHLYTHTGDVKYADYYEKSLYNHILGQQDPKTGMIAYFLPMLPGAHKVYSTPDSSFWCCVGSGFENQAKYGEAIYYHDEEAIYVNLFIPSALHWKEKGFKLKQETAFPAKNNTKLLIESASKDVKAIKIRFPSWAQRGVELKLNGKAIRVKARPGSYITLKRSWKQGDQLDISFPMSFNLAPANDNPKIAAITYGPIVLAGKMGTDNFSKQAPYSDPRLYNDYYTYDYQVPTNIIRHLQLHPKQLEQDIHVVNRGQLIFKTDKEGIMLRPLYDIHRERYVVYWNLQ